MLDELLATLNNWFVDTRYYGKFVISGGKFASFSAALDGQYIRIEGSIFNDGLHKWPCEDLRDEEFQGRVSTLKIPKSVIDLSERIAEYRKENAPSELTSESFGGYSYSKVRDESGSPKGWRAAFSTELRRWRKL